MSIAIHVIRLRCLWARIHASLYSDTASCNTGRPSHNTRVGELRAELEDWLASMPPIRPRRGVALTIFATNDWFELNYNYCILLLYRGEVINKSRDVTDEVLMECLQAAKKICDGYRRLYIGKPVNCTWGAVHFLFTAGLTYLHCIRTAPAAREAIRYDEISRTCMNCTMVLVVMAERWKEAAPYRDIFEALASRTMAMTVEMSQERPGACPDTSSTPAHHHQQQPDPGDFTQWMAAIADSGMPGGIDELLDDMTAGLP